MCYNRTSVTFGETGGVFKKKFKKSSKVQKKFKKGSKIQRVELGGKLDTYMF